MRARWIGIGVGLVIAVLVVGVIGVIAHRIAFAAPRPWGNIVAKTTAYLNNPTEYDLLFIGDSKAFCAFHPDVLAPLVERRPMNLAHWGVWLPAQYSLLNDLIPRIPQGTTVVWSIGSITFTRGTILPNYPLSWSALPTYLAAGFTFDQMAENLLLTLPPLAVLANRNSLRERADQILEAPLRQGMPTEEVGGAGGYLGVGRVEMFRDNGRVVSKGLFKTDGAYLRREIDPQFYRLKQRREAPFSFEPDPAYMALFLKTLDMLKASGLQVIVNELEEAPWTYGDDISRKSVRRWMDETVRLEVEKRGFPYIRVDFDQLQDDHYFDYNHMNSQGVEVFSKLFAPSLADALRKGHGA